MRTCPERARHAATASAAVTARIFRLFRVSESRQATDAAKKNDAAVLPDAPSAAYKPLTNQERFKKFVIDTVHPLSIGGAAVGAGIGTAADPYPEWGDGGEQ